MAEISLYMLFPQLIRVHNVLHAHLFLNCDINVVLNWKSRCWYDFMKKNAVEVIVWLFQLNVIVESGQTYLYRNTITVKSLSTLFRSGTVHSRFAYITI